MRRKRSPSTMDIPCRKFDDEFFCDALRISAFDRPYATPETTKIQSFYHHLRHATTGRDCRFRLSLILRSYLRQSVTRCSSRGLLSMVLVGRSPFVDFDHVRNLSDLLDIQSMVYHLLLWNARRSTLWASILSMSWIFAL